MPEWVYSLRSVLDVEVIEDPAGSSHSIRCVRACWPSSRSVGLTRQEINHHLRTLESHGLVRLAEERRWGGLTERLLIASAASYVMSPGALGAAASGDPARTADPLSARYLIAVAARIVREVGALLRGRNQVATFALDTEIRFVGADARAAFADELTRAVTALVSKHHVAEGSAHRLVVAHPIPKEPR